MTVGLPVAFLISLQLAQIAHVCLALDPQCRPGSVVGDTQTTAVSNLQTPHGMSTTTVLFDPQYMFPCCGVVTGWQYQIYNQLVDGCYVDGNCYIDFMVWKSVEPAVPEAILGGQNTLQLTLPLPGQFQTTVTIPPSQQIPIQPGYYIGFNGFINGIIYKEDLPAGSCANAGLPCTAAYMQTVPNFQINTPPFNYIKPYPFSQLGGQAGTSSRYYYITAITDVGYAPQFTTLPAQTFINSTTAVGTTIFRVLYTDNNTMDALTSILDSPITTLFAYDPATGSVTLNGSVANAPYLTYTLTFQVTDQCQTTVATLSVTVIEPNNNTSANTSSSSNTTLNDTVIGPSNTSTNASSSSNTTLNDTVIGPSNTSTNASSSSCCQTPSLYGLLNTKDGVVLVGLLAANLCLTFASLLGLCCLCYLLRGSLGRPCAPQGSGGGRNNKVAVTVHAD